MERFRIFERINILGCGVAHDLNNLLEQIVISVSVLRSITPADDRKAQKLIAIIESSAHRAGEVMKKIATNSAYVIDEPQPLHFDQIIRDIERAVSSTFPKEIQVDTDIEPSLWQTTGSPIDIYQALINLCINARDAMPDGGKLSISVKNTILDDDRRETQQSRMNGKRYVCVRVADTGVGIEQKQLQYVFEPYYTSKKAGKGNGLGLFNVRHTVESYGGFITVESSPGQGTVFYLYFPITNTTKYNQEG